MRQMQRLAAACTLGACGLACGQQQQVPPVLAYVELDPGTRMVSSAWEEGAWTAPGLTGFFPEEIGWQEIASCPITGERALVTLCRDRSLWLSGWTGFFWNTPVSLAADAGASGVKVFAHAYEHTTGELMTVYRKGASSALYYRTYTSTIAPESSFSMGLSNPPQLIEIAARPRSDELLLTVRAGNSLYAAVWNGTSWGNTVTLETNLGSGRPFTAAYMSRSGRALVVWSAASGAPKYRVWNSATNAWSAAGTLPAISGSAPAGWVSLTPNPLMGSDEVLAVLIGTNNDVNLVNWTGSAWGSNLVAETNAASGYERRADIGYQLDGARAVAAWHTAGSNILRYRVWNGSSWSATATGPDMGSEPQCIRMVCGSEPDEIILAVRRRGAATYADYIAYSSDGSVNLTGTIEGPVGGGSAGDLPEPPPGVAAGTSFNVPNSGTLNLPPGTYLDLDVGNSCTVNFNGAGDYVIRKFTAHYNGTVFNFNGEGGDIRLILSGGDFDGKNNMTFTNNSSGSVEIHVKNGDFDSKNNNFGENILLFVYNGNIDFGNNLVFHGLMYASGSINGSGTVTAPTNGSWRLGPGAVSTATWRGGAFGARTDHGGVAPGSSHGSVSLVGRPAPDRIRVTRWREVGPDE